MAQGDVLLLSAWAEKPNDEAELGGIHSRSPNGNHKGGRSYHGKIWDKDWLGYGQNPGKSRKGTGCGEALAQPQEKP